MQIVYFFAKFIAKGAIYERRNKQFASDSLGDAAIKLYKVEINPSLKIKSSLEGVLLEIRLSKKLQSRVYEKLFP